MTGGQNHRLDDHSHSCLVAGGRSTRALTVGSPSTTPLVLALGYSTIVLLLRAAPSRNVRSKADVARRQHAAGQPHASGIGIWGWFPSVRKWARARTVEAHPSGITANLPSAAACSPCAATAKGSSPSFDIAVRTSAGHRTVTETWVSANQNLDRGQGRGL